MLKRKITLTLALALSVAACSTTSVNWNHASKGQNAFSMDEAECRQREQAVKNQTNQQIQTQTSQGSPASKGGAAVGVLLVKGFAALTNQPSRAEQTYMNCMKAKGYRVDE